MNSHAHTHTPCNYGIFNNYAFINVNKLILMRVYVCVRMCVCACVCIAHASLYCRNWKMKLYCI